MTPPGMVSLWCKTRGCSIPGGGLGISRSYGHGMMRGDGVAASQCTACGVAPSPTQSLCGDRLLTLFQFAYRPATALPDSSACHHPSPIRWSSRTTGELISFYNFGNSIYIPPSQLSSLGSALSKPHGHCPDWDKLGDADLQAVPGIRGSAPPNSNNHDKDHPNTLSTLLGCDIDNSQCPQHLSPITYRAYALYSSSFVHHYFSWAAYLADRLWDSLIRLRCDLEDLQCHDSKAKALNRCDNAMPLLYSHGFTPPEGMSTSLIKCSDVGSNLEEVISGGPIARLMSCMDEFLQSPETLHHSRLHIRLYRNATPRPQAGMLHGRIAHGLSSANVQGLRLKRRQGAIRAEQEDAHPLPRRRLVRRPS
ncbi:ribosome binding protein [Babesia ovata]|uniref:Ribosome binding protein n=1 Tax=Babesia ovata TaxID=189622 RepID=A0A2H6KDU0_9APIC|nr:ribosome binding protein [Babesia ovata]GBE61156.1 ribosome binding protein [Babesia ovata]